MMMNKKRVIIFSGIVVLLLVIVIFRINSSKETPRGTPAPIVILGKPSVEEIRDEISLTGDILPVQQANVYSKVSGNIEKIFVDIGDYVRQGQVLALMDTTLYSQNARSARGNFLQADVGYVNNKTNFERSKSLYEQKLIARQDLDNAQTAMESSGAQREAAYANYQNSLTQLSYCKITAPFTGVITKRLFDPGAFISAGGSGQNASIFILMNGAQLKSIINIPEKYVPQLSKISDVEVTADAIPNKTFKGKLSKISEAVDLQTRTMAVEINIENPEKQLKPGMFATINLVIEKKPNSLVVPNQVLLNDGTGDFVFELKPDTTAVKKYVKTGIRKTDKSEIVSGLTANDRIIVVGQNLIKEGTKVKIVKQ